MPLNVTLAPGGGSEVVRLHRGQVASFSLSYTLLPAVDEEFCPEGAALQVVPPGSREPLLVRLSITPCNHGALLVTPIAAGRKG